MADAEKELRLKFTGDASQLGAESKKAAQSVDAVTKNQAAGSKQAAAAAKTLNAEIGRTVTQADRAGSAIKRAFAPDTIKQATREVSQLRAALGSLGSLGKGVLGGVMGGFGLGTLMQAAGADYTAGRSERASGARLNTDKEQVATFRRYEADVNLPEGTIEAAILAAKNRAADAPTNADAARGFSNLGLAPDNLPNADGGDVIRRLADAYGSGDKQKRLGLAEILGKDAEALLGPLFAGGDFQRETQTNQKDSALLYRFSRPIARYLGDPFGRGDFAGGKRVEQGELSLDGLGSKEAAERTLLGNKQARNELARQELAIEDRLKQNLVDQAALQREIARETDVQKKARLDTKLISLEAEASQIRKEQQDTPKAAATARHPGGLVGEPDQFQRLGLFIGGTPQVNFQAQTVQKLEAVLQELKTQRTDNSRNWGN